MSWVPLSSVRAHALSAPLCTAFHGQLCCPLPRHAGDGDLNTPIHACPLLSLKHSPGTRNPPTVVRLLRTLKARWAVHPFSAQVCWAACN